MHQTRYQKINFQQQQNHYCQSEKDQLIKTLLQKLTQKDQIIMQLQTQNNITQHDQIQQINQNQPIEHKIYQQIEKVYNLKELLQSECIEQITNKQVDQQIKQSYPKQYLMKIVLTIPDNQEQLIHFKNNIQIVKLNQHHEHKNTISTQQHSSNKNIQVITVYCQQVLEQVQLMKTELLQQSQKMVLMQNKLHQKDQVISKLSFKLDQNKKQLQQLRQLLNINKLSNNSKVQTIDIQCQTSQTILRSILQPEKKQKQENSVNQQYLIINDSQFNKKFSDIPQNQSVISLPPPSLGMILMDFQHSNSSQPGIHSNKNQQIQQYSNFSSSSFGHKPDEQMINVTLTKNIVQRNQLTKHQSLTKIPTIGLHHNDRNTINILNHNNDKIDKKQQTTQIDNIQKQAQIVNINKLFNNYNINKGRQFSKQNQVYEVKINEEDKQKQQIKQNPVVVDLPLILPEINSKHFSGQQYFNKVTYQYQDDQLKKIIQQNSVQQSSNPKHSSSELQQSKQPQIKKTFLLKRSEEESSLDLEFKDLSEMRWQNTNELLRDPELQQFDQLSYTYKNSLRKEEENQRFFVSTPNQNKYPRNDNQKKIQSQNVKTKKRLAQEANKLLSMKSPQNMMKEIIEKNFPIESPLQSSNQHLYISEIINQGQDQQKNLNQSYEIKNTPQKNQQQQLGETLKNDKTSLEINIPSPDQKERNQEIKEIKEQQLTSQNKTFTKIQPLTQPNFTILSKDVFNEKKTPLKDIQLADSLDFGLIHKLQQKRKVQNSKKKKYKMIFIRK